MSYVIDERMNEGSQNYERFAYAGGLINQLGLFDDENRSRGTLRLPSHRETVDRKLEPDWAVVLELLNQLDISLDKARKIHNALNPDRAYSAVRFRIKFRQEMARIAS